MYEAWRKKDAVGYLTKLIHTKRKKSVGHMGLRHVGEMTQEIAKRNMISHQRSA